MKPFQARRWLLATLLAGGLYLGAYLTRGWYPHDEGALGQMAERVLQGEMPHRDFDDPYTGLLTYLHAAAFRIGGLRLPVLRVPLFLGALCGLAACFGIARRFVAPAAASGVALVALAWSVPNYPASVPSWYNLFFALFGVLALMRWEETGSSRWTFLAGLAGGVSFLFKLSGLFYVAGALLFLLFATRPEERPVGRRSGGSILAGLITLGLAGFVLLLVRAVAPYYWPRVIYHFVAPGALLAAALAWREWTVPADPGARWRRLAAAAVPFVAGVAAPVAVYALVFATADALPALLNGVFVAPFRRLTFATMRPPAPFWLLASIPLVILLRPRPDAGNPAWRRAGAILVILFGLLVWLAARESFAHRFVWQSLRGLIPAVAALAAAMIVLPGRLRAWSGAARRRFLLVAAVTACAGLIQFPFSSPIYFLYVAPLLLLSLTALVAGSGQTPRPLAAATLLFYGAFAVFLVTPGAVVGLGFRYELPHVTARLDLPRGGLRVPPEDAALYQGLIPRLAGHAGAGEIWAGPDAPEVYFLGGFRNRTRAVFDFLDPASIDPARVLASVQAPSVRAVAINLKPSFSPPLSDSLLAEIRREFPEGERVGRFELRWGR